MRAIKGSGMVSITEALELIHTNVKAAETEILPIESAVGYVSAENLHARFDLPRFDNSAMDGYAVTMADAGERSFHSQPSSPVTKAT